MDSLPPALRRHWPLALAALLAGLYGWALVIATGSGHDGVIGPHFNALGADWVIFLAAGRAVFHGNLAHIYNQAWITQAVNSQFAHWLSAPLPFPLFPYPPVYLLLVAPFALLSVAASLWLSQLLQFATLAWALRRQAGDKAGGWFVPAAALLAPAASNNVLAGSNALLVAVLIVGGFALLETAPLAGGALLGLVVFKPQFLPLLPLALVAARKARALAALCASILAVTLLSAALFGPQLWLDWANVYLHPQAVAGVNASDWGHLWDDSVATCVALLGAPLWLANAVQVAAAIGAAALVWQAFRSHHPLRLPLLLCAACLAAPHVSNYDLILPTVAALLLARMLPESSRPLALVLPLAAWLAPLYDPPRALPLGLVTPLVLAGLAWQLWQAKTLAKTGPSP